MGTINYGAKMASGMIIIQWLEWREEAVTITIPGLKKRRVGQKKDRDRVKKMRGASLDSYL